MHDLNDPVDSEKSAFHDLTRAVLVFLINSAKMLEKNGTIGFIIPLSYVSTPRMRRLREELGSYVPEQYILGNDTEDLSDSLEQILL